MNNFDKFLEKGKTPKVMVDGVDWERWEENRLRGLGREKKRDHPLPSGGEEDLALPELRLR